ncbi:hypothetical protein SMICM304S_09138 [Streptomyces microflavus]
MNHDNHDLNTAGIRPAFMVRVAGLPVESVQELRCPQSRRWADEVLDESAQLRLLAEKAGDQLHDLIGGSDDEPLRRALLKLRPGHLQQPSARDGVRRPDPRPGALLDPAAASTLADWLTGRRALDGRLGAGAGLLAAETGRSRDHAHVTHGLPDRVFVTVFGLRGARRRDRGQAAVPGLRQPAPCRPSRP